MKILGIDTSCDDSSIGIVEKKRGKFKILANVVSSQIKIHRKYGGVYPTLAKREHQKNLVFVLKKALEKANLLKKDGLRKTKGLEKILEREEILKRKLKVFLKKWKKPQIDLISVTNGPGLEPCLWVGINFAKALSKFWKIKLVPIDHIKAHILVNLLNKKPTFPALALVISGGHSQLILMEKFKRYRLLGETRDDAAGECFDKCGRILGLSYPGGPAIEKLAEKKKNIPSLPRPMIYSKDYDFSFSGLKTALLYKMKGRKKRKEFIKGIAFEIQEAIIDVLLKKTLKAVRDFKVKTVILGGGVSANKRLRERFKKAFQKEGVSLFIPPKKLSLDNGLMVAIAGYFEKNRKIKRIRAEANLRI